MNKAKDYIISRLKEDLISVSGTGDFKLNPAPSHVPADLSAVFSDFQKAQAAAKELAKINELVESAIAAGPFLNLTLNKEKFYQQTLAQVSHLGGEYGYSDKLKGQRIFIEYSSPNIAKPMGVGHLRSTIIGESLARIYEALGAKVIRENYLGDWGTQFGKLIYAYQNWADRRKVARNPIHELKELYVEFQRRAENNPEIEEEARKIFFALEKGDRELKKLWREFRDLSVKHFKGVYKRLGIKFDVYSGESRFAREAQKIVDNCLKQGVCQLSKDSSVFVELPGVPSFILRKSDGATLYLARDLAALQFRIKKYRPNVLLYVVGAEQKLHFQQLFALAEKLGYLNGHSAEHIDFGLVRIEGKKMSTRRGTTVSLELLIQKSVEEAEKILAQKSNLPESRRKKLADLIGIGAIFYNDLRQFRTKDINFDWQKMINFEGSSSAYLQYTHARIRSILKKTGFKKGLPLSDFKFEKEIEFGLLKKIAFFPEIIGEAADKKSPNLIVSYLESLAQLFNSFYGQVSVIKTAEENLKQSRLYLINGVADIVKTGLFLLGIKAPDKM